jgi:hypothetical protein
VAESTELTILDAAKIWQEQALLADGSLFGKGELWTAANLQALQQRLGDPTEALHEIDALRECLNDAEPALKQLLAELLWIFYLPVASSCMSAASKAEVVRNVYNGSGETLLPNHPLLREMFAFPDGSPGLLYCARVHIEIAFLIRAVISIKEHEVAQRQAVLGHAGVLARKMDLVSGPQAPQLTHIVRHLLFPDIYEPVFCSRDKRRIVESFAGIPRSETKRLSVTKLDEELTAIRGQLQPLYGDQPFSFVWQPLASSWRRVEAPPDAPVADQRFWVERLPAEGRPGSDAGALAVGSALWVPVHRQGDIDASALMRDMEPGDVVFHLTDNVGLTGVSVVAGALQEDFRCPEGSTWAGESGYCVPLRDYTELAAVLPQSALLRDSVYQDELRYLADKFAPLFFNHQLTLNQNCYLSWAPEQMVRILDDIYRGHRHAHLPHVRLSRVGSERASVGVGSGTEREDHPQALVLHGASGTGKTWTAMARAVEICDGNLPPDMQQQQTRYQQLTEQGRICLVTLHPSFGYGEFVEQRARELREDPETGEMRAVDTIRPGVLKTMAERAGSIEVVQESPAEALSGATIWKVGEFSGDARACDSQLNAGVIALPAGGKHDFGDCSSRDRIREEIESADQDAQVDTDLVSALDLLVNQMSLNDFVILADADTQYHAIGRITGEYAAATSHGDETLRHTRAVQWLVQFDEPQGWHQISRKKFQSRNIYRLDQSLLRMDELKTLLHAEQQQSPRHVLIIDEIGRGELSAVFGETLTLLSADRAGFTPPSVYLPLSRQQFSLPENLFLLGTLNAAEATSPLNRQILHRRFAFEALQPDPSLVCGDDEQGMIADGQGGRINLRRLMMALNQRIEALAGPQHCLGHGFFMHVQRYDDLLAVLRGRIVPQLCDLFDGDWRRVQLVFQDVLAGDQPNAPQIVAHRAVDGAELFGSAESGASATHFWLSEERELSPDAFRKIYGA